MRPNRQATAGRRALSPIGIELSVPRNRPSIIARANMTNASPAATIQCTRPLPAKANDRFSRGLPRADLLQRPACND
jgi:hypothetical protein